MLQEWSPCPWFYGLFVLRCRDFGGADWSTMLSVP